MSNIYLAKLNINERIHDVYKEEVQLRELLIQLFNDIDEDKVIINETTEVKYKIVDIEKDPDEFTIKGRFIRIYKTIDQDFYDPNKDELTQKELENSAEYVAFTFYVLREIIAFVPKQKFTRQQFLERFTDFIEKCSPNIGKINLQIRYDKEALEEKYKKIATLREISVVIVPPNGDKDLWKGLESIGEELEETEAKKMSFSLFGTIRKPLNKSSDLVKGFKQFVKSGYGDMKATGRDANENPVEIDTLKDEKLVERHKIHQSLKDSPSEIENQIKERNIL